MTDRQAQHLAQACRFVQFGQDAAGQWRARLLGPALQVPLRHLRVVRTQSREVLRVVDRRVQECNLARQVGFEYYCELLARSISDVKALSEAGRMLAPGGKLYLGEFHKPELWVLRALSWTYFKVFEPLGLALWDSHDPMLLLEEMGGWKAERTTFFFGNFQIVTATKL